jgi:S1-C subfamily serine protease
MPHCSTLFLFDTLCSFDEAIILELNITFGLEFIVLHTTPSIFNEFSGACLKVMWTFQQRTFYIGSLRVNLILACQKVPLSRDHNWKKLLILYAKKSMENFKGPTLMKSLIVFVLLLSCHVNIFSLQIWIVLKSGVEMAMLQVPEGNGSGFIWDEQGHIVTNYHGKLLSIR